MAIFGTYKGLSPSLVRRSGRLLLLILRQLVSILHISPRFPMEIRFVLFRFHSPLLTEFLLISFPPPTEMLQFGGFPFLRYYEEWLLSGGPIRQFADQRDSCLSPRLIAACHDLLRLSSRAIPQSGCSIMISFFVLTNVRPLVSRHINSGFSGHYVSPQGEATSTTYPNRQSTRAHKASLRPTYGIWTTRGER